MSKPRQRSGGWPGGGDAWPCIQGIGFVTIHSGPEGDPLRVRPKGQPVTDCSANTNKKDDPRKCRDQFWIYKKTVGWE